MALTDANPTSGPDPLADVSEETRHALERHLALLADRNQVQNLVARSTLDDAWTRHVVDSAQLLALAPAARRWLDLGAGAGFPGLVIAILLREAPGARVDLVESNNRKAGFLRSVANELGLPVRIHPVRTETLLPSWREPVDVVTARAFAPLPRLLDQCGRLLRGDTLGLFPKGEQVAAELEAARATWRFECEAHPSRTNPASRILAIRNARRITERGRR